MSKGAAVAVVLLLWSAPALAGLGSCEDTSVAELSLMTLSELDFAFCAADSGANFYCAKGSLQPYADCAQCSDMRKRIRLVIRDKHKVEPPTCDRSLPKTRPAPPLGTAGALVWLRSNWLAVYAAAVTVVAVFLLYLHEQVANLNAEIERLTFELDQERRRQ